MTGVCCAMKRPKKSKIRMKGRTKNNIWYSSSVAATHPKKVPMAIKYTTKKASAR